MQTDEFKTAPVSQSAAETDQPEMAVDLLRRVIVGLVRREGLALSTQQFGVFMACYMCPEAATLRGLVQELDLPRAVVARALDKLAELDLVRREPDPRDSRNQFLLHTEMGRKMVTDLHQMTEAAASDLGITE